MSSVIRSLVVKVGADLSDMEKGLKQASKSMKSAGKELSAVGATLTKGLTLPIVGVSAAAIKMGSDFEDSLAKVATIADTSKKSLSDISTEVLSVSNATGAAASEINEALYQAISAGADTADATKLVETAVKAAKGGFTDTTTAVDGLTSVLNTYGMETADAESLANKFLVTQNKGKTTFGELAASIGKVAPTAAAVGVSVDDLLSGIASLTANGIGTSEAVTGLKAALSNVIKPSTQAAKTAKQLGLDFSASALQSKGLAGFLADVQEKTGGNVEVMSQLFGSVEGLNAVLTLTSDNGAQLMNSTMAEMATNTTALDEAFNTVTGTASGEWAKLWNELKNTAIQLGQTLLPVAQQLLETVVKPLVEKIKNLTAAFAALSPEQQKTILTIVGVVAAAGPLLAIIGGLFTNIGILTKGISSAIGMVKGIGSAFTFMTSPAGIALAAIAAIAAAAFLIYNNWDTMKEFFTDIWDGIKGVFSDAWDFIKGIINSIIGGVEGMANGVIRGLNTLISGLNKISFSVPDWVPLIGGKSFGFSIKQLSTISIPRLSTGAVIQPNKKFLAMLGDQNRGVNIETPLSTMIDAFNTALDKRSDSGIYITITGNTISNQYDINRIGDDLVAYLRRKGVRSLA